MSANHHMKGPCISVGISSISLHAFQKRDTFAPRLFVSASNGQRRHNHYVVRNGRPFRMAVLGSGPAGFYTAYKVMSTIDNSMVDMYEQLPVPFGLVRYGVAPDHPEVKVRLSYSLPSTLCSDVIFNADNMPSAADLSASRIVKTSSQKSLPLRISISLETSTLAKICP